MLQRFPLLKIILFVVFIGFLSSNGLFAAEEIPVNPTQEFPAPSLLTQMTVLSCVALLPFFVMMLTSYIKVIIVLSLLRNAIGVQQAPPNQVLNGIAILISIYVMFPTGMAMYKAAESTIKNKPPTELFSAASAEYIVEIVDQVKAPLKEFLQRNTSAKHVKGFYQLAQKTFPEGVKQMIQPADFIILIPSFITSQLKVAFEVGVLIYLPFFVIDLVTSNILLAMGMMMLSPLTIALPLKLLLIVMIDGWTLIIQGLVLSFR